jgi:hypothetical protein
MFNDLYADIIAPGAFILLNSKHQTTYEIAFNNFKNILTNIDLMNIGLESVTIDFEEALVNGFKKCFQNVRIIGNNRFFFYYYYYYFFYKKYLK